MSDDHAPLLGWGNKNIYLGVLFFVLAAGVPVLVHTQFVTGPIINGLLILATLTLGTSTGLMLSFVPSLVALVKGLLPTVLSPTIPFIMASNVIFVGTFAKVIRIKSPGLNNFIYSLVVASLAKFIFLFLASHFFLPNILVTPAVIEKATGLLGFAQFITALIGGVLAYPVYLLLKKLFK